MTIKAIETRYKGYRFRSRLEARWAVFFDALGLPWNYEVEGFNIPGVGYYLPDFLLEICGWEAWVEIKPDITWAAEVMERYKRLCYHVRPDSQSIGYNGLYLAGDPGNIPHWNNNIHCEGLWFAPIQTCEPKEMGLVINQISFAICPFCSSVCLMAWPLDASNSFRLMCNCTGRHRVALKGEYALTTLSAPPILDALRNARSARFEYGETPRVPRGKPKLN